MGHRLHRSLRDIPPQAVSAQRVTVRLVDGRAGDHVPLAPPYIATGADIDRIVEILGEAVDAAIGLMR